MDKSFQPSTNATESTQLNGAADKLAAKPNSKTKVKSDNHVNKDNQVIDNNQPDLFKSELDIVNTIIPDDENIDYNTLIEQSIVKTPDKARTPDANDDIDTSQVLDEPTKANSDSMQDISDATNTTDELGSHSSFDTLAHAFETNEADNATDPNVLTESDEPKVTRISAKQRREELDHFKTEYLTPHNFKKKHNVAIEDEQWEQLDLIARRIGDRKANATSYLYEIIAAHLREVLPKTKEWVKL